MTEIEELRLAYAECSRQKNELLTAHKVSAADNAALRERVIQLEEELDNTQEQLHHTIQSQKFWFKAACDAGWESDQA